MNPGSTPGRSCWSGKRLRLFMCEWSSAVRISFDFGAMFPFTGVPAYNLPVYASQRPLPDATQDSVRGCSLGFAAAVIADGRLQRACKAQRSSNRIGFRCFLPCTREFSISEEPSKGSATTPKGRPTAATPFPIGGMRYVDPHGQL